MKRAEIPKLPSEPHGPVQVVRCLALVGTLVFLAVQAGFFFCLLVGVAGWVYLLFVKLWCVGWPVAIVWWIWKPSRPPKP